MSKHQGDTGAMRRVLRWIAVRGFTLLGLILLVTWLLCSVRDIHTDLWRTKGIGVVLQSYSSSCCIRLVIVPEQRPTGISDTSPEFRGRIAEAMARDRADRLDSLMKSGTDLHEGIVEGGRHFYWMKFAFPSSPFMKVEPDAPADSEAFCVFPALILLIGGALFCTPALLALRKSMRTRRRLRDGCCVDCGYDLAANTSGVCPECGRPNSCTTEVAGGPY